MPDLPFSLPADARCSACGYLLNQLTVPRCPECGQAFDPEDVTSYFSVQRRNAFLRRRAGVKPIIGWVVATLASALFMLFWLSASHGYYHSSNLSQISILLDVMIGLVVRSHLRERSARGLWPEERRLQRRLRRWMWGVIAFAFVTVSFSSWSCPHGVAFQGGPFVFTYTGRDGMCRSRGALGHRHELTDRLSFYVCWRRY